MVCPTGPGSHFYSGPPGPWPTSLASVAPTVVRAWADVAVSAVPVRRSGRCGLHIVRSA